MFIVIIYRLISSMQPNYENTETEIGKWKDRNRNMRMNITQTHRHNPSEIRRFQIESKFGCKTLNSQLMNQYTHVVGRVLVLVTDLNELALYNDIRRSRTFVMFALVSSSVDQNKLLRANG